MPNHDANPNTKIEPGDMCFALYLPAYTPEAMTGPIPGSKNIILGTAVSDYGRKPAKPDAARPVAYFMPNEPFENTELTSGLYQIRNWRLFPSYDQALRARSAMAKAAVEKYEAEIRKLNQIME